MKELAPSVGEEISPILYLVTWQLVPVHDCDKSVFNLQGFVLVCVPAPQAALQLLHPLY